MHILNVANPASPSLVTTYDTPGSATKVYVDGQYAYISDGAAGVQILDITDPAHPALVGTYDTGGSAGDIVVRNGLIYVEDGNVGLLILQFIPPDLTPPAAPTDLTASADNQQINLSWTANTEPDVAYYTVYRSLRNNFTPTATDSIVRLLKPATTFSNTGLINGTTYYYRLAAVDSSGNRSAFSLQTGGTPTSAPLHLLLSHVNGEIGEKVSVSITLTNPGTKPVGGLEFQVIRGSSAIQFDSLATTAPGFSGSTNTVGDTTFVVFHSGTSAVLLPGNATIGALWYQIASEAPLCTPLPLTLRALEIGDSLGVALPDSSIDGEIQAGLRGDLNLDRRVSILDVIQLVRILVEKTPEPDSTGCHFFVADFNGDQELNILDVVGQINTILHVTKQMASPVPVAALIQPGAAYRDASGSLMIPIRFQSDGLVAGLQATVRFDPSVVSIGPPS